jgi:hypothetical protein
LPNLRLTKLDAREIADAIRGAQARPEDASALQAAETHRLVRERFDVRPWAERVLALYDQVLSTRCEPRP